jgi:V/A-type H+-transporting ATPase subunit D
MPRLVLNKAELGRQRSALQTYRRFLPSLDLKRRQLLAERNRARGEIRSLRALIEERMRAAGQDLPMLADGEIGLDRLVAVDRIELGEENVVGVRLPVLARVETTVRPYGLLVRPHWVDRVAERLVDVVRLELEKGIAHDRLDRLDAAVVKVTQRVNLFDKVLIPRAEAHVRRIRIRLGDAERAAVVTAKIAKRKRQADHLP